MIATRRLRLLAYLLSASLFVGLCVALPGAADSGPLSAVAAVEPGVVVRGDTATFTIDIASQAQTSSDGLRVVYSLPSGFRHVPGSTRVLLNGAAVSAQNPVSSGNTLTWAGLHLPAARAAANWGMHTFVQDRCDSGYIAHQLDRVRELMGGKAFVTQLFYRIDMNTAGPERCWVDFVNACYDRDLIPVVRLQGSYGGQNWIKPPADAPGDYGSIAAAYARVVAGLPRRDGRLLYVEIWNEPNLDIEWSGAANPIEYAHFMVDVAAAIRGLGDARVRILNGALSPGGNYPPLGYIDAMATVPGAMAAFDVWAAHPYPGNHPPEYNMHDDAAPSYRELTIDSYLLELERLAAHGRRDVPVLLTETGYALGQNNFTFQGYAPIDEANRADYMARAFRDGWSRWAEVVGVCPYELVDPHGSWHVWDWLFPDGRPHAQYDAVRALDKQPVLAPGRVQVRFKAVADAWPGTYHSAVQVTADGVGSVTLSDVAALRVLAPPPTATPSPTPSSTPTRTPTPPLVCQSVDVNGGMEEEGGWLLPSTAYRAAITADRPHSGARSLRLGIVDDGPILSYSTGRQAFTVPETASLVRIRFWYYPQSEDVSHGRQYALLLDENLGYLETLMWLTSDAREWRLWEADVSRYRGQTLWLNLGVYNDGQGGATAMYVDDVEIALCGVEPPATLTPAALTPTATQAPSATSTATPSATTGPATATPSPSAPACQELLVNGDLEGVSGWTMPDTARPARYVATTFYGGQQAVALGVLEGEANVYSYSSMEQAVDLPEGAALTLTYWHYPFSADLAGDRQYVLLLDDKGGYEALHWTASDAQTWTPARIDLSAHAGRRVTLRFGVYNDGQGGATGMIVDSISLEACYSAPPRSPTAGPVAKPFLPLLLKAYDRARSAAKANASLGGQVAERSEVERLLAGSERLSERSVALSGLDAKGDVRALALDPSRQRVAVAVGPELLVLDALTEQPLLQHTFPAPISAVAPGSGGWHVACGDEGLYALGADGAIIAQHSDLGRVSSLAADDERVYAADVDGQRVVVLDAHSYSIMQVSLLQAAPHPILLDAEGRRLYVGEAGTGGLLTLHAENLQLLSRAHLAGMGYCHDLALSRDGSRLYVAHALSPTYGAVSVVDTQTMAVEQTRWGNREARLWPADALALDELHGVVYMATAQGVDVLDGEDLSWRGGLAAERSLWPRAMQLDGSLSRLYMAGRGARLSWYAGRTLSGATERD